MSLACLRKPFSFPNSCLSPQVGQEEEGESDIFSIREVSFQSTGESEWKDTNYTLNTDSLDWVSTCSDGLLLGLIREVLVQGETKKHFN